MHGTESTNSWSTFHIIIFIFQMGKVTKNDQNSEIIQKGHNNLADI